MTLLLESLTQVPQYSGPLVPVVDWFGISSFPFCPHFLGAVTPAVVTGVSDSVAI